MKRPWLRQTPMLARSRRADEAAFRRVRLHLTAWYVLTLATIVIVFSVALYAALAAQLGQHQNEGPDPVPSRQAEQETTDFALSRLRIILLAGNLIFLGGAAGGAYLLAGKTLQPVADALERQRRFTADASHELRTPLTVMRGVLDLVLQRERSGAAYREALTQLSEEVSAMTELVEHLLRLARGSRRPPPATEGCDVQAILDDVLRSSAALADSRGSTVDLASAEPLIVQADCRELRQVFLNLVSNGLQHTPAGTRVSLATARCDGCVVVTVSDSGPGIPEPERDKIFEPFYRVQTTGADGTGLGLALCRELVAANGGTITLAPSAIGASFEVRLPLAARQA